MKKKIYLSIALVTVSLFYSFSKFTSLSESNFLKTETFNPQDSFLLGSMHDYRDSTYIYLSDTLGFNFWHKYTIPKNTTGGWGWPVMGKKDLFLPADQLDTPVSRYVTDIRARLDTNNSNNLLTLLDRPKFEYLAFGQRSDYQCENISKVDADYWFYTYYNSTDNGTTIKDTLDYSNGGSGYVKQCLYDNTNPGANAQMLFDSLRGNKEQINTYWPVTWLGDSHEPWYIMPRIRIDSAFANNPSNQDIEVCKVIIKNRDGDSLTQVIKVKNFKPTLTSVYHGNYIDSFYNYDVDPIVNLKIPAGYWFNDDPAVGFGDQHCRVDFKVYWYDKCNMWIDRIRVEDERAHKLLTLHQTELENYIRDEVEDIAMAEIYSGNQSPYKFYIEEFEMNHLPCIGYLNKKIKDYSGGRLSLMVNYNYDLVKAFIPNYVDVNFTPRQVKRYLIDSAGVREIFTICYNLEGWQDVEHHGGRESFVPTTLYNGGYEILSGLVVYTKSPSEYDNWIQDHFDNYRIPALNFKRIMEFSDSISKIADVPFNFMTQAHLWIGRGHMLKEPTNEEIALSTNLAISYGAKGIMYFSYGSTNSTYDTSAGPEGYLEVARGLTDPDDSPRRLNVYGQNKWEAIKSINNKIKKWDEYLMSFDTSRKSFILRSEYSNLYSQTYFSDVITYRPFGPAPSCIEDNPNSSVSGAYYECKEDRYLQVATFQNSEPNTK